VLGVKVGANAQLLDLDLAGSGEFGRPDQCMIVRMVEIVHLVDVNSEFAGEVLGIQRGISLTAVPVQPREVSECEGHLGRSLSMVPSGARWVSLPEQTRWECQSEGHHTQDHPRRCSGPKNRA
jgi:hypothetical protein